MKTRFSSLVTIKKDAMQKSERIVQKANLNLHNAEKALRLSFEQLQDIPAPQSGQITDFLANRTLLDAQRRLISHNEEWIAYATKEVDEAKEQLKYMMIEYEKFKYLEHQEIEKLLKEQKVQEAKDLDEVALMTFTQKAAIRKAS